ncbi:MAG: hydroxyacid dehydrogenase [Acidobacteria bacterium]|nr:hydroxyacid dehydrogenase [Acidobacteriota bacterium]
MFHVWTERALPADITAALDGLADMIGPATDTPDDPLMAIPQAHGIIAAGGVFGPEAFDRAISALVLSRTGIGYDKIDVPAATERGIAVCNTPDAPTISTAEFALALLLSAAKKLKTAEHALMTSENKPRDYYKEHEAIELYGRRLGLVGFGRIGRYVAKVAQAMGMVVAAYDPFVAPAQAAALGVELRAEMADVLADADFVSLHLPLSKETYRIVNADVLAKFKRGAMLINASRGGLVDEAALEAALDSGQLSGFAADVTDPEPPLVENPLLHRPDVLITPHVGSATAAGKHRILTAAVANVAQVLRGERPQDLVNPEVWPRVEERLRALRG